MRLLLALILGILTASSTGKAQDLTTPANCADALLAEVASRYGIGVLAETHEGHLVLGVSPYVGSLHNLILDGLVKKNGVRRVLWMGEMRYSMKEGQPLFHEANETSGRYVEIRENGLFHEKGWVRIENSVDNIPPAMRGENFIPKPFDADNMRLVSELQKIKKDVRHSIGNSLQTIFSITILMTMTRKSIEYRENTLTHFRSLHGDDVQLVQWLMLNLLEDGRLNLEEAKPLMALLSKLRRTEVRAEEFLEVNAEEVELMVQKIASIVNPQGSHAKVDLYEIH